MNKTQLSLIPVTLETDPERYFAIMLKEADLDARVGAEKPLRASDDDFTWAAEWKRVSEERKKAILTPVIRPYLISLLEMMPRRRVWAVLDTRTGEPIGGFSSLESAVQDITARLGPRRSAKT